MRNGQQDTSPLYTLQVVAGTNYRLLLSVTCSNGTWENGAKAVVVEATAFQPLPNSNVRSRVSLAFKAVCVVVSNSAPAPFRVVGRACQLWGVHTDKAGLEATRMCLHVHNV